MRKIFAPAAAALLVTTLTLVSVAPASADEVTEPATDQVTTQEVITDSPAEDTSAPAEDVTEDATPTEETTAPAEDPATTDGDVTDSGDSDTTGDPGTVNPGAGDPAPTEGTEPTTPNPGNLPTTGNPDDEATAAPKAQISTLSVSSTEAVIYVSQEIGTEGTIDGYSVIVTGATDGYKFGQNTPAAGELTFTGLTPNTEYTIEVTTTAANATPTVVTSTFKTSEKQPAVPKITNITVGKGSVTVSWTPGTDGGPANGYALKATPVAGGEDIVQERGTVGDFELTGLAEGLYSFTLTAYGDGGKGAVGNYFFVIPTTPAAPVVSPVWSDTKSIVVKVTPGQLANPIPTTNGPTAVAASAYTLTLLDGDKEVLTDSLPGDQQYYTFRDLKADTGYTLRVTHSNPAGVSGETTINVTTTKVDDVPAPEVIPPAEEDLTTETRGDITVPAEATVGDTITVNVGADRAGETVNGFIFSTPTALGSAVVDANGNVTFTIPNGLPAGAHRVAVTDAQNNIIGWGNIQVAAAPVTGQPGDNGNTDNGGATNTGGNTGNTGGTAAAATPTGSLAVTGSEAPIGFAALGALLLAAGVALMTLRRRQLV